jgi:hypothetical protein
MKIRGFSLGLCLVLAQLATAASASELGLSRSALQALVSDSLFTDHGKWYFQKGLCYALLERPRLSLAHGRIVVVADFAARQGLEVSGSCVGAAMTSEVTLSGLLAGAGSQVTLRDIRIDKVSDQLSRNAIELLRSSGEDFLPKTVTIDVLPLLEPATLSGTGVRVEVSALRITQVLTQNDSVLVTFDASLNAH